MPRHFEACVPHQMNLQLDMLHTIKDKTLIRKNIMVCINSYIYIFYVHNRSGWYHTSEGTRNRSSSLSSSSISDLLFTDCISNLLLRVSIWIVWTQKITSKHKLRSGAQPKNAKYPEQSSNHLFWLLRTKIFTTKKRELSTTRLDVTLNIDIYSSNFMLMENKIIRKTTSNFTYGNHSCSSLAQPTTHNPSQ